MTGIFLIFAACLLWALDTLIRYPLLFSGLSPWSIVWLEHLILVVVMLYWIIPLLRSGLFNPRNLRAFFIIGGLGSALSTVAFTQAFSLINPSVVILIQKLQPLIAVTLAAVVLGEKINRQFAVWMAVCIVGSVLIAAGDLAPAMNPTSWTSGETGKLMLGYGCTLLAVIGWGAATVYGKQLSNWGFNTAQLMAGRFIVGFLVLTPLAFLFASPWSLTSSTKTLNFIGNDVTAAVPIWILIMVIVSGLGGMSAYYLGMKRLPARVCAIAEMFFPIAAVAINWVFLGKALSSVQLFGAAVLLTGSAMVALSQMDEASNKRAEYQ